MAGGQDRQLRQTSVGAARRGLIAAALLSCLGTAAQGQGGARQAVTLCFEGSSDPGLDARVCSIAIADGGLAGHSLATLHVKRGRAFVALRRDGDALADFEAALGLNPLSAEARHGRGLAYHAAGDYDQAVQEFDAALALSPSFVEAVRSRATARFFKGELEAAIADFDAELAEVPIDDVGRIFRGLAHYAAGHAALAARDLGAADGYPYRFLALWRHLALRQSGGDGLPALTEARAEITAARWPAVLFDHFLGLAEATQVLAEAQASTGPLKPMRMAEAHLFLGEQARLAGDNAQARRHFEAAAANDGERSVEGAMARLLLARLQP